jgi:hypothetical protein
MSLNRDSDDTVNLPRDRLSATRHSGASLDDTDRLRIDAPTELRAGPATGKHPYAEGIIRFYRARTILDSSTDPDRAWRYLEQLLPNDLPASSRWQFLNLVYFMQQDDRDKAARHEEFRERVLTIASLIDNFVDRLNLELDRAS